MKKTLLFSLSVLCSALSFSQNQIPTIQSNVETIDIRDGDEYSEGNWNLAYDLKPDIYESSMLGKTVTFYTDLDSISFVVHSDSVYDFVIVNGTDSAFTQLKYKPSKLDILKNAWEYDFTDNTEVPEFTYQDSSNVNLRALRNGFNLDSVAGTGNEITRILNLLDWVHDLIPHDGQNENPAVRNAMGLIEVCSKKDRGLNCRGLATVLNECYLSMGFKSRFVTCMPKDSVFMDCHVINMVYSNDLDKWIWVDPTHGAYVMDETGELLGFGEVRERLIKGEPLILNPNAHWNNRSSTVKEFYLEKYMAKNLYRFQCPLRSEYDSEGWEKNKTMTYVELLPLDGFQQTPKYNKYHYEEDNVTTHMYKTNNPDVFWAKPE